MAYHSSKSPEYSVGFEPLQVEEDDDFEELELLTSSQNKVSSSCCSEVDEGEAEEEGEETMSEEENNEDEEDEEDSSGSSAESDTSEFSTADSRPPKDASHSLDSSVISKELSSSGVLCKNLPQDVSTSNDSTNAVKHNYGLQKMPSYEFKLSKEGSKMLMILLYAFGYFFWHG
ncbi:unnamed protein product [Orchesella dallaii]|uniref:Uncharacterized protein n=1 Tax=Orchesella dallaii TaxID=48710 RepID=A0ABP1R841_9HEXA